MAGTALLSYLGQKETNETNMQLGQDQMAFQERMSNSSYQRAVTDMQAAGLNPMLAYSQGGASSPVGSMPQVQNALGAGVHGAAQAMGILQGVQQVKQSEALTDQANAQAAKIRSETLDQQLHTARLAAEIKGREAGALRTEEDIPRVRYGSMTAAQVFRHMMSTRDEPGDRPGSGFAADVERRKAESILKQLEIPGAKATADFFKTDAGSVNPHLQQFLQLLKGLTGALGR